MMRILLLALSVYFCFGIFLFFAQRSFIYFPTPPSNHPYPEISYKFDDATVRVVTLNTENKNAIIYFGGNGEAVEYNASTFERLFSDHAVYLVKYRGYGGSTGQPSEDNICADALNIFDKLRKEHSNISVIGRSLGSGVATFIASQRDVNKLVLVTPYDSIESLAQKTYPIYPMSLLLKDKYDSVGRAQLITSDTLFLLAENDKVIGRKHSENLFKAFREIKPELVVISDSGHNTISNNPRYNETLRQFIYPDI